jgi:hypothetical protein
MALVDWHFANNVAYVREVASVQPLQLSADKEGDIKIPGSPSPIDLEKFLSQLEGAGPNG